MIEASAEETETENKTNGDTVHDENDTKQPNSPLLTSRSLSTASLDNVNLEETSTVDGAAEKGNYNISPTNLS